MPNNTSNTFGSDPLENTDWRGQPIESKEDGKTDGKTEEKDSPTPPTNSSSGMGLTNPD